MIHGLAQVPIPTDCPVVSNPGPNATCNFTGSGAPAGGEEIACSLIRECDPMTSAVHFEYALPSGNNPNVDINVFDPNTGDLIGYNDASGAAVLSGPLPFGTPIVDPATGAVIPGLPIGPAAPVPARSYVLPSVANTPAGGGATQTQVAQATNSPTINVGAQVVPTFSLMDWFTGTTIDSIPNWVLALGAAGLIFFLTRRR